MPTREIIPVWNKKEVINNDHLKTLQTRCAEVKFPLDKETKKEVQDIIDTFLYNTDGVGLAAPQIGISKSVFVFDPNYSSGSSKTLKTIILAINPKIVPSIKDLISTKLLDNPDIVWEAEACLSLPNIAKKVPRLKSIKLKAFDINGKQFSKRFNDYSARIIQHEMDHLYGRMIVDYSDPESYITKNELSLE